MKAYLSTIARVAPSDIADDDGEAYLSLVDGSYIGRVGMDGGTPLPFLKEHGVTLVQSTGGGSSCLGFSETEKKWYGWSHRAIFGFGIGSEVKQGDCAYMPSDKDDFLADCIRFWDDEHHDNTTGEHAENIPELVERIVNPEPPVDGAERTPLVTQGEKEYGVRVSWTYSDDTPNEKIRGDISSIFSAYPDTFGRGAWQAETLDDAKQMAADFAEGVS